MIFRMTAQDRAKDYWCILCSCDINTMLELEVRLSEIKVTWLVLVLHEIVLNIDN